VNRGAELFAAWLKANNRSQLDASYDLRVSKQSLNMYLSGDRKPGREIALKLRKLAKIPIDAWDNPPENGAPEPSQSAEKDAS